MVEDPADITGELIYDVATTMEFSFEGYPLLDYTETIRAFIPYVRVYEYSAIANDWHMVGDWVKAPGYE